MNRKMFAMLHFYLKELEFSAVALALALALAWAWRWIKVVHIASHRIAVT